MPTLQQLLNAKGQDVLTIPPDATVLDAIKKMADANVGAIVVVQGGKVTGIFTERHYAREVFLKGRSSPKTRVGDVMATRVSFAPPDQTVQEAMAVMTDLRIRHLPVMDQGRLLGIVSMGDLVKSIISDQQFVIEQLERYISG